MRDSTSSSPGGPDRPGRKTGGWRKTLAWLLLALVGAEILASLTPLSAPRYSSFLKYQHVLTPAMVPAEFADGTGAWITHDPRHPVQYVPAQKKPGTFRVICFGGSAAAGLGHSPNVTFAHHLEGLLEKHHKGGPVELINLGTVAISSKQVALLVKDALASLDPDLLIVYSGNNEFLEPHAERYAAIHGGWKESLRRGLRKSALIRTFERSAKGPGTYQKRPDQVQDGQGGIPQGQIIEDLEIDVAGTQKQWEQYRDNLAEAAKAAHAAGVPIITCRVAVNWRWFGKGNRPFLWSAADPKESLAARRSELKPLVEVTEKALTKEDWLRRLEYAELSVAIGEDPNEATRYFMQALERDPHQRRATVMQGSTIDDAHSLIFDSTEYFLSKTDKPFVGFAEFYDYVHFTPYGAALLAEGLFGFMAQEGLIQAEASQADGYALDHQRAVLAQIAKPETPDFLSPHHFIGVGWDPANLESRDLWKFEKMKEQLTDRIEADPKNPVAYVFRGNVRYFEQGRGEDAVADYQEAISLGLKNTAISGAVAEIQGRPKRPTRQ